jgi:hypothetical protein
MGSEEYRLLAEVGPRLREQGHYTREDLAAVGDWKSVRIRSRLGSNSDEDIRDITAMAFTAPERFQHLILTLLRGVQVRTASALLTIWDPDRHTVMDVRAIHALHSLGAIETTEMSYPEYLNVCRGIAGRLDVDLRTLDRALWRWDRDGRPTAVPV